MIYNLALIGIICALVFVWLLLRYGIGVAPRLTKAQEEVTTDNPPPMARLLVLACYVGLLAAVVGVFVVKILRRM